MVKLTQNAVTVRNFVQNNRLKAEQNSGCCVVSLILINAFNCLVACFLQEYLARLEAIRRQNFQERKELQRRMAGVRAPVEVPPAQVWKDS